MSQIAGLTVKLGLVTLEWDEKTAKAKKQAESLKRAFDELGGGVKKIAEVWKEFGGALSAISLGALIAHTIEMTAQIKDLSNGLGISVEQTLAFRDALNGAGADADQAARIMSNLFAKIDDAKQGNDKVVGQFEELGISFKELKNSDPYDLLIKVSKGFENITDKAEKAKILKEFFGKTGIQLDLKEIGEVLEHGTERFAKHAEAIKVVGEVSDRIKKNIENLSIAFAQFMQYFTSEKIISIDQFKAILLIIGGATLALGLFNVAKSIMLIRVALAEAAIAGASFNLVAGPTSPLGLLIKLVALGAAGLVLFKPDLFTSAPTPVTPAGEKTDEEKKKQESITEELTKHAQSKYMTVQLTKQLTDLEHKRLALQVDMLNGSTLESQKALEHISLEEKLLQIRNKLAVELKNMEGESNAGLRDATKAQAQEDERSAKKRYNDAIALMVLKDDIEKRKQQLSLQNEILNATISITESGTESPKQAFEYSENLQLIIYNLKNQVKESIRLQEIDNERLKLSNDSLMLTTRQSDLLLEQFNLKKSLNEEEKKLKDAGVSQEQTDIQIENLRKVGQATIDLKQQTIDAQRTFEYGWTQAYNSYMDTGLNAAKTAGDMFSSITQNMESALDKFVKTGKLNFKDFTRSVIQDLLLIQMKAQMKSMMGGGGIMDMFKGLFGGSNSGGLPFDTGGATGSFFAADGGDISQPTIVGENGPELFVPKTNGTVIPNGQLSSTMGGKQTIYNGPYIANMSAIDTKSFEDYLYGSSKAVWAANQYATKSLATGAGRT